ncbi:MAG TPA: right-handed parallel beta-helix repeat-containing protein [Fuerstia sp.]|nr:right-handed parallel beta-helix repeat-containing protein [Fuerstiella sp.]
MNVCGQQSRRAKSRTKTSSNSCKRPSSPTCKNFPHQASSLRITVNGYENVTLDHVTLYASNCFGFFETSCKRNVYRQCVITRRTKDDFKQREDPRIRSLDADAFHRKHAVVGPQLIECTAHFQADDWVNICGDYHMVMAADGPRLRVLAKGQMNIKPGAPLEIVSYDGRRMPDAKGVTTQRAGKISQEERDFMARQRMHQPFREGSLHDIYEVVIDRPIDLPRGSVIADANQIGNGFQVTNCDFGFNRSRGILIKASHGTVSGNKLQGCHGEAIKVSPEYWWLEAGSSNDLQVIGNEIRDCQGKGIAVYALNASGRISPVGAHNRIVIKDNQITAVKDTDIWVTSTKGLVLQNNQLDDEGSEIKLEQCEDVQIDEIDEP